MENVGGKRGAEEQLALVEVAKELQRVWVCRVLPKDRARLQDELVRAEVLALEEGELVLVGEVQRPHIVLSDAEVEGFDALGARICAIVAGWDELGAPERDLVIEDGLIANENLDWFGFGIEVKLWDVLARSSGVLGQGSGGPVTLHQRAAAGVPG